MGWGTDLAIYGAALATWTTARGYVSERARKRDQRRSAGSRAIAGMVDLLYKIDPNAFIGGIPRDRVDEAVAYHADIWDVVRGDLEALRVSDGRQTVDQKASEAITALNAAFAGVVAALRDRGGGAETDWDALNARHTAAKTAVEELKVAVRV